MLSFSQKSVMEAVQLVLSASLACDVSDFHADGVFVHLAEVREGRFRYLFREPSLQIATMGKGVVVSSSSDRLEWVRRQLGHLTREQLFSGQTVAKLQEFVQKDNQSITGPDQKYVCSAEALKPFEIPKGIRLSMVDRANMAELYKHAFFTNALIFQLDSPRPDMLAAVAECEGKIVGIAGASADADRMWQVGVDVLPEYQGGVSEKRSWAL